MYCKFKPNKNEMLSLTTTNVSQHILLCNNNNNRYTVQIFYIVNGYKEASDHGKLEMKQIETTSNLHIGKSIRISSCCEPVKIE